MMTLSATVRGQNGNFMFDTGGGISYVSPAFARTIGCKVWGQIGGFTLTGQRLDMPRCDGLWFEIESHSFSAPESGVFDIMKFMPPNVPRIDGSIGLDVFRRTRCHVESGGKEVDRGERIKPGTTHEGG